MFATADFTNRLTFARHGSGLGHGVPAMHNGICALGELLLRLGLGNRCIRSHGLVASYPLGRPPVVRAIDFPNCFAHKESMRKSPFPSHTLSWCTLPAVS